MALTTAQRETIAKKLVSVEDLMVLQGNFNMAINTFAEETIPDIVLSVMSGAAATEIPYTLS